jgi:hypothetical protein
MLLVQEDKGMNAQMINQASFEMLSIQYEARRFCDERGIKDFDDYQRVCASFCHREFMRGIEPYMKLKTRIYSMRILDRIVMDKDGKIVRTEYKPFPAETQRALDQIEEMILAEAARWGFSVPSPTSEDSSAAR